MIEHLKLSEKLRSRSLIGALLLSTVASAAFAQNANTGAAATTDNGAINEVIVTAQRRSESVQKVPLSITAISSATIQKYAIETFADYAKLAPNVATGYSTGGTSGVTSSRTTIIRGITGTNTTSFYIDDTPLPQSIDPRMFNLDHIEVLRGPQGTLFGASSMGGTVRVITRPPTSKVMTGAIGGEAFTTNKAPGVGGEASAVVYTPLIDDTLSASGSAFYNYTPGYFKRSYNDPLAYNPTGGTKFSNTITGPAHEVDNVGASTQRGLSGSLRYTPIEGLTISPMVMWQDTKIDGFPLADYDQNNLIQRRILNVPEEGRDEFTFGALTSSYRFKFGRVVSSTSYFDRKTYDQEDGSDANVRAFMTAYTTYPQGPFDIFVKASHAYGITEIWTQEARYETDFDFPVQAIAGVFYQDTFQINSGRNIAPGLGAATGGFYTDNIFTSSTTAKTKQLAGFVGLNYKPIDALELSAGVRYTDLKKHTEGTSSGIYGTPGVTVRDSVGQPVTPRFSAKYNFTPDTMVYATASQGFRLGGVNGPVTAACAGKIPYPTSTAIPYSSDTLWSYEGGLKTTALNKRVSISADVYHIDWTGIQQLITLINGGCYASLTVNLGTAVSQGFEFESTVRVNDNLTVQLATGYDDARITDPGSASSNFRKGEALSNVPKWTASLSPDYVVPTAFGSVFARGSYTFAGQSISYTENVKGLVRNAYSMTDLRVGAMLKGYTLALYAKNIFDARANLADEAPVTSIAPGRYRYFVGPPRTIGVDIKYNF